MSERGIRSLLPKTSRHAKGTAQELIERIDRLEDKVDELRGQNVALQASVRALEQRPFAYLNPEYASLPPGPSPRILLAGWYGAENFGDELMMQAVLEAVPDALKDHVSVLLWDNPDYPQDLVDSRVTLVHYPRSTWELRQLAAHFDALVWGGGAIIDDHQFDGDPSNTNTGNLFVRLSALMLGRGKRVLCLGLSTNDALADEGYLERLRNIVEGSSVFSVRDPRSREVLLDAGIDVEKVGLVEDLAYAKAGLGDLERWVPRAASKDNIEVALVPLTLPELLPHYVSVVRQLGALAERRQRVLRVSLVPLVGLGGEDAWYCSEIARVSGCADFCQILPCPHTLQELGMERYDVVVSYKYHSALVALCQGVPCVLACHEGQAHYPNKMSHLARTFGVESQLMSLEELEGNVGAVLDARAPEASARSIHARESQWLAGIMSGI